jgi:hypothetical protein
VKLVDREAVIDKLAYTATSPVQDIWPTWPTTGPAPTACAPLTGRR